MLRIRHYRAQWGTQPPHAPYSTPEALKPHDTLIDFQGHPVVLANNLPEQPFLQAFSKKTAPKAAGVIVQSVQYGLQRNCKESRAETCVL